MGMGAITDSDAAKRKSLETAAMMIKAALADPDMAKAKAKVTEAQAMLSQ
jgi:hypothetical protein